MLDLVAGAPTGPSTCSIRRFAAVIRSSKHEKDVISCVGCGATWSLRVPVGCNCAVDGRRSLSRTFGMPLWYKDSMLLDAVNMYEDNHGVEVILEQLSGSNELS
jgi:hypothetical protein